jgi:hypothetical protein
MRTRHPLVAQQGTHTLAAGSKKPNRGGQGLKPMQAHTPSHHALSERGKRDANDTMTRGTGALVVNTVGIIMAYR